MEEVWKDISLASLQENPTRKTPLSFQDFFSSPQQPAKNPVPATGGAARRRSTSLSPATVLRLNSGSDRDGFGIFGSDPIETNTVLRHEPLWNVPSMNVGFDAFATGSGLPVSGNKRLPDPHENHGERRHQRMVKNRESAARSRARKQAYTTELELEIANLVKENAKLRKSQEEFYLAVSAAQAPKKKYVRRATTAPL